MRSPRLSGWSSVFILFAVCVLPSVASAQSITLTSPTQVTTVAEGDDYASTQLQNAWDFNQRRDIGWEENFSGTSVKVTNGVWQGTNAATGGYVFPLFGGFKGGLFAEGPAGDLEVPRLGINRPVDTSRYRLLSYKLNHSWRSSFAIYWQNDTTASHWPDGSDRCASFDGFYNFANAHANSGPVVYSFDLSTFSGCEQHAGSWSGNVVALRIDPSTGGPVSATTEIDWIRLVDPDSAPTLNITWNSSNLPDQPVITLWVDQSSSGYAGHPIARFAAGSNPGSYALKTAMLPPGTYYFYLTVHSGNPLVERARSGYSAALVINQAPNAVFSSPTELSGEDYATSVLGNPWDMSSAADLENLEGSGYPYEWRQFSSPTFANGEFSAIADPPIPGNNESDVQVHMNIPTNTPVDTRKYRYLTYRLWVDETNYPTIADKIERGWVSRPVYWNFNLFGDGGRPKAHNVYEGYKTYTIDLWDTSIVEAGLPFQANNQLRSLRIDPLETTIHTQFKLDWVKLTSETQAANGAVEIAWVTEDPDSTNVSATLYYDNDRSGYNGTQIVHLPNVGTGNAGYTWNTSGVAEGSYYIYIELNDGNSVRRYYAPGAVRVGEFTTGPQLVPPPYDYDGDGKSDQIIYRPAAGGVFFLNSSAVGLTTFAWGGPQFFRPIHGDFDGDNRADYAVVVANGFGYLDWYVSRSSDNALYARSWGLHGDLTAVADFNGDNKDDIAVWRPAEGNWYVLYEDGTAAVQQWGLAGDIPVPADYDGDGKADFAIWRPADGNWWIINSGFASGVTAESFSVHQWGLWGDYAMPGDYNGDGKADPAVWRPWNGTWYLRDLPSNDAEVVQWGLPGDEPRLGDFNGDGVLDVNVWRASDGTWYHNHRNGSSTVVQWGLPGLDRLPLNIIDPRF